MTTANLYRALQELLPQSPLQVATVTAINTGQGTCTVTWPGGSVQTVRGAGVAVGSNAFVRDGIIEGAAPSLDVLTIDV
ncbi:MAG: hypothetical protein A2503_10245 [Burkholderiales bacterium RIFOXYD12_FULL_59_19]|nr:MAG: hypothetical protein A2503_10245 [Burkholderiales bacterium RIFOXYD12_FULL_59_19]